MAQKEIIATDAAPGAIGPYSQGVKAGGFVFVSGQLPVDPATGTFVEGDIAAQTAEDTDCAAYTDYGTFEGNPEVSIGGTLQGVKEHLIIFVVAHGCANVGGNHGDLAEVADRRKVVHAAYSQYSGSILQGPVGPCGGVSVQS